MSNLRVLQVLVIEDEPTVRDNYEATFSVLRRQFNGQIGDLRFASSFEEAADALGSSGVFHLVILDLCLPLRPNQPAQQGVALGLTLLELCLERDEYPIPGLLVISGHVSKTEQSALKSRLEKGFSYGALLVKGGNLISELALAIASILKYENVDIRTKGDGNEPHLAPSPRENDLLRRAAILMDAAGLNLSWPVTNQMKAVDGSPLIGGSMKTLVGRVLMDGGESLRTIFFSFAPADSFLLICQNAKDWALRRSSYARISHTGVSGARMLVVAEVDGIDIKPDRSRVTESAMSAQNKGERRVQVVRKIQSCDRTPSGIDDLIAGLRECEPEFAALEADFVRDVFVNGKKLKNRSPGMVATMLSLHVGAFGEKVGTENLTGPRRRLSKLFDQTLRKYEKKSPK
jgi:CheY-like chemotaxis protein